ncbi:MAG: hypothetical protein ABI672_20310 [Vicinamibacteria bacterium]
MMKVRFDVNDVAGRNALLREVMPRALEALHPDQTPNWGGMGPQQMVEHLLWAFDVSNGLIETPCPTPEERRVQVRPFLSNNRAMPISFENPLLKDGLPSLRFETWSEATAALTDAARTFLRVAESDPSMERTHPLFGPLNAEGWSRLHFKHVVHHFLQFGLIEVEEVPAEKAHA